MWALATLAQRLHTIGQPQPVAAPAGLQVQLRPYQLEGLAWLQYLRVQHLGGILADDMGLGKTAQALAHVLLEKQAGQAWTARCWSCCPPRCCSTGRPRQSAWRLICGC